MTPKFILCPLLSLLSGILICPMVKAAAPSSAPLLIDRTNNSWEIVVEKEAPDSVHLAARELQEYVERSVGVKMPITATRTPSVAKAFYLGDSTFARDQGIKSEEFAPDGFRIVSGDSWIVIAGKDYKGPPQTGYDNPYRINESYNPTLKISAFGDTGTQQGVYEFLRTYAGIRWYMPGPLGEIVPTRERIEVAAVDIAKHPAFQQRYAYFCFFSSSNEDALYYKRVGFGTPFPVEISHSFGRLFLKYKDEHPEYFALIDGKRDFTNLSSVVGPGNLNMANPDVVERAITEINKHFDEHPNEKIFGLSPPDGMRRISEDPASQAMIDLSMGQSGKFSNYVWGFINKVAAGVRKKHPDKLIGCIAYESYGRAPSNIEKMEPNIAVTICKLRRNHWDPAVEAANIKRIEEWKEKGVVLYCWEYYCDMLFNPGWRGLPVFFPQLVKKDLMQLNGITRGEFLEAESWTYDQYADPKQIKINYPGLQHPLLYVTAQMLWDPNQDLKAMLDEYYELFYGDAKDSMKKFWMKVEDAWIHRKGGDSPSGVYDRKTVQELLDSLAEAKTRVKEGSVFRQRIEMIENEFAPAATRSQRLADMKAPSIKVGALAGSGKIDGTLENDLWKDSTLIRLLDASYQEASPATHVRVGWTPEALLLAITCFEPKMAEIKASVETAKPRLPNHFWSEDSVDIYIKPEDKEGKPVFQFAVNPNGVLYNAIYRTKDWAGGDQTWESGADVAVKKDAGKWVIELRIPWKNLGVKSPAAGQTMRANIYRSRMASGVLEKSSWAPLMTGFHFSPDDFGTMTLENQVNNQSENQ